MILSASRRTDIPAFYSAWLLNRLRQGFVCVRNPMNPAQVSRIALSPETVDCIVFWTKDPAPMLDKLGEIRSMGYEFYFQFTLTPYGREIERHLPEKRVLAETFRRLSRAVGRERVVWRYDPVLLTGDWTPDRHFEAFGALCRELEGCAEECVFSFVDRYAKIARRTAGLVRDIAPGEMERTAAGFAETARRHGLKLSACAETADFSRFGIGRARCIDPARIERLTGCAIRAGKDRNQRPECGCIESADIGAYDTCRHGCLYCYASAGDGTVRRACAGHDPLSPLLTGRLLESDRVTERKAASLKIRGRAAPR